MRGGIHLEPQGPLPISKPSGEGTQGRGAGGAGHGGRERHRPWEKQRARCVQGSVGRLSVNESGAGSQLAEGLLSCSVGTASAVPSKF